MCRQNPFFFFSCSRVSGNGRCSKNGSGVTNASRRLANRQPPPFPWVPSTGRKCNATRSKRQEVWQDQLNPSSQASHSTTESTIWLHCMHASCASLNSGGELLVIWWVSDMQACAKRKKKKKSQDSGAARAGRLLFRLRVCVCANVSTSKPVRGHIEISQRTFVVSARCVISFWRSSFSYVTQWWPQQGQATATSYFLCSAPIPSLFFVKKAQKGGSPT